MEKPKYIVRMFNTDESIQWKREAENLGVAISHLPLGLEIIRRKDRVPDQPYYTISTNRLLVNDIWYYQPKKPKL